MHRGAQRRRSLHSENLLAPPKRASIERTCTVAPTGDAACTHKIYSPPPSVWPASRRIQDVALRDKATRQRL